MMIDLRRGDCLALLKELPDDSVDAVVTDPPAGIEFMGATWDTFDGCAKTNLGYRDRDAWGETPDGKKNPYARGSTPRYQGKTKASLLPFQDFICEVFTEVYRVLKPGGHMLVWAIPRTSHHTAMGIERAGFEIRDVITHLFGVGFPKSLDVSKAIDKVAGAKREVVGARQLTGYGKANVTNGQQQRFATEFPQTSDTPATDAACQWQGWGTALKPASEHWILARKSLDGTVAANVLEHGTGAINVDGCRIGFSSDADKASAFPGGKLTSHGSGSLAGPGAAQDAKRSGFDAQRNAVGRWPANVTLDEEAAAMLDEQSGPKKASFVRNRTDGARPFNNNGRPTNYSSQRVQEPETPGGASRFFYVTKAPKKDKTANGTVENNHPTVKNTALMRWLVRLITPPGGIVLDPFMGSGSTGVACVEEGCNFVGMEREENFFEIARKRIRYAGLGEGRRADEKPATDDDDEEEEEEEDSEG